jgi:hypothetical protein
MKIKMFFSLVFVSSLLALQSCVPGEIKINSSSNNSKDSISDDSTKIITSSDLIQNMELSKAGNIITKIVFPAGRLTINSAKTGLLKGEFKYTNMDWKPGFTYTEKGDTGNLKIEPEKSIENVNFNDNDTCRWFIGLNQDKKYDLSLEVGACKGDINLENFKIQKFDFSLGAGEVKVNLKNTSVPKLEFKVGAGKAILYLTGEWRNNLKAEIDGGVGEIEIHLPKKVKVKAEINGFLGTVDAAGFSKNKNIYTNECVGKSPYILDLVINGAIGQVKLVSE